MGCTFRTAGLIAAGWRGKSRGRGQMVAQSRVRNTCGPPTEDSLHAPEKPKGPGIPTEQVGAVAGEGNDSFFDLIFILHW